jgi:RHS repeat-associated protein
LYNGIDQTTTITAAGPVTTGFGYVGATQAERITAGATTQINGLLGVQADTDTTTSITTYYEKDPAATLLSERVGTAEYYYYFDGTGSVLGLIDPTGTQRGAYTYDPYGSHHTASGVNGTLPVNPWRYAGGYLDTATGLYHLGARYYQPALGRFTQQDDLVSPGDPANGNRYAYAGGDPINQSDPSGRYNEVFKCGYVTCTLYFSQSDVAYFVQNEFAFNIAGGIDATVVCFAIGVGFALAGFACGLLAIPAAADVDRVFGDAYNQGQCVKLKFVPFANVPVDLAPTSNHCNQ